MFFCCASATHFVGRNAVNVLAAHYGARHSGARRAIAACVPEEVIFKLQVAFTCRSAQAVAQQNVETLSDAAGCTGHLARCQISTMLHCITRVLILQVWRARTRRWGSVGVWELCRLACERPYGTYGSVARRPEVWELRRYCKSHFARKHMSCSSRLVIVLKATWKNRILWTLVTGLSVGPLSKSLHCLNWLALAAHYAS